MTKGWYKAIASARLCSRGLVKAHIAGQPVLLARLEDGTLAASSVICPHEAADLSDGMIYMRFGYADAFPAQPGDPPVMDSVLCHIEVQRDPETNEIVSFTGYGNGQCAAPRDDSMPGHIDVEGIPARAEIDARGFPYAYRYRYIIQ